MRKLYIATIQVAVVAESQSEACDAVSEYMHDAHIDNDEGMIDWQYLPFGGVHLSPVAKIGLVPNQVFFEGEAFRI